MVDIKRLAVIGLIVALGSAHADGHTQAQPGTQPQWDMHVDGQLGAALNELRQMERRLGQVIDMLETHTRIEDRLDRMEQQARVRTLGDTARGLRGLRADIDDPDRRDDAAREIGAFRRDIDFAFAGARGEERQRFDELRTELTEFEEQVRAGEEDVTERFDEIVGRFDEELDWHHQRFDEQMRRGEIGDVGAQLRGLRTDIETGRDHEGAATRIGQIRERLEQVGRDLQDVDRERFEGFAQDLQTLEQQVRMRAEQAGQMYRDVMDRFDQEIRDFREFHRPDTDVEPETGQ